MSLYSKRRQSSGNRVAARRRRANRNVRAKMYDNVDPMSLNNPHEDPDADRYAIKTPDNFQEDPEMGAEWQKDGDFYAPESNFMLPMNDEPVNADDFKKIATMKTAGCLKIAQSLFPDIDESDSRGAQFINSQAALLVAGMNDASVIATLKNIKAYEDEAAEAVAEVAAIEASVSKEAEDKEVDIEINMDSDKEESAEASEEEACEEGAEDELVIDMEGDEDLLDVDQEIMAALAQTEQATNASTELGIVFDGAESTVRDVTADLDLAGEDAELAGLFGEGVQANYLTKSASRKSAKNMNMRTQMNSQVHTGLSSLWDCEADVNASF